MADCAFRDKWYKTMPDELTGDSEGSALDILERVVAIYLKPHIQRKCWLACGCLQYG